MIKIYEIFYNDGAEYGTMKFKNKTQTYIEDAIRHEIESNNKNVNHDYHITRDNFKLKVNFMNSKDYCSNCGDRLDQVGARFCSNNCKDIYDSL